MEFNRQRLKVCGERPEAQTALAPMIGQDAASDVPEAMTKARISSLW